jgi:MinD superfamily P-loop ATPase
MKIAVTGGKGGTGKSTLATALAFELSKKNKILLIDADVDCPNDNLILSIQTKKVKNVEIMNPKFDKNKCIKCGKCSQICKENAIVFVKGKCPFLIPDQCTGCRACKIACPVNAISEQKQKVGEILAGKKGNISLITGKMKPGIEESSLIVNAVKKYIKQKEKEYDFIIIDTAAGAHCPVIAALLDTELGIAVTEPTPLGAHDLSLILKLMKKLRLKSKVIINRSDIAKKEEIKKISNKFKAEIIAEIPYSKQIQKAYTEGIPIKHKVVKEIAKNLQKNVL